MKIKTNELIGTALDWAVAQREHNVGWQSEGEDRDYYSTDWAQGGPIIERENVSISRNLSNDEVSPGVFHLNPTDWLAQLDYSALLAQYNYAQNGPTPLIAAMRCYVASELGNEVEVPAELL